MALQGNREAFGVPVRRRVLPNVCGTTGVDAGLVLMPRAWRGVRVVVVMRVSVRLSCVSVRGWWVPCRARG